MKEGKTWANFCQAFNKFKEPVWMAYKNMYLENQNQKDNFLFFLFMDLKSVSVGICKTSNVQKIRDQSLSL